VGSEFFANWTTQLRKGLLELAILNALRTGPVYGYEIVRRLAEVDGIGMSEATVYPILNRLRRELYVEAYLQESPDGPARKYYRLTTAGREELRRMNEHWAGLRAAIDRVSKEKR
jgi:PadR family transcriptional regulator PadR